MKNKFLKHQKVVKTTTSRKEYNIRSSIEQGYGDECAICPMRDHCYQRLHCKCSPFRVRERNWKSQRKTQYK